MRERPVASIPKCYWAMILDHTKFFTVFALRRRQPGEVDRKLGQMFRRIFEAQG